MNQASIVCYSPYYALYRHLVNAELLAFYTASLLDIFLGKMHNWVNCTARFSNLLFSLQPFSATRHCSVYRELFEASFCARLGPTAAGDHGFYTACHRTHIKPPQHCHLGLGSFDRKNDLVLRKAHDFSTLYPINRVTFTLWTFWGGYVLSHGKRNQLTKD